MRRVHALAWLLLAVLVVLVRPAIADARPVIPPEREDEVQALLRPHRLGHDVVTGWRLESIAIELATIRVRIVGPAGDVAEVTLDHHDYAPPGSRRSESFGVAVVARPVGSEAAVEAVVEAVERNDDGRFWPVHGAVAIDGEPEARFAVGWRGWITDGLLTFAVLLGIAALLLVRALREAPRWTAIGLLTVVVVGAILRLAIAEETTLEPWSYTRFMIVAKLVYEGPSMALLHPEPLFMTDVITTTVLACAIVVPIPVFLLARGLLGSDRAALVCAGLVAVLPLHIRFSHSDVSSIPSLTISALMFAMALAAAREPSRRVAIAMLVLLPVPMVLVFLLRPPNILYASLLLVLVFAVDRSPVAKSRLLALVLVVLAVTLGFGVPHLLEHYGREVREGLSVDTLGSALEVIFSFEYDSLLNPRFTPPGVTLLAIVGAVDLGRRRRWRLLACLAGWLLASLVVHAYVVPKSSLMQARYHLHLVIPFVCLAACGIEAAFDRIRDPRRARMIAGALTAYIVASPAIHLAFIRDVELNDQREWTFVHDLRAEIPAGCTIVEYAGEGAGSRFARVGAHVVESMPRNVWTIAEASELDALLGDRDRCLYWYEGLPCFGQRPPGTTIAPACAQVHEDAALEEVRRLELVSRPYDENLARGLDDDEHVTLRLFRIVGRAPAAR